jgi:hypothetical protein
MATEPTTLEGTWEEILARSDELAGKRVRLTVLPGPGAAGPSPVYRPASGRSLLRHAGTWAGDDFEDCLRLVYETRSPAKF